MNEYIENEIGKLHTEDVEIMMMESISEPQDQPLWLSIGPSFTMVVPIILMALVGAKVYGNNSTFLYMGLITGGSSCLLGAMWGINNYFYKRRSFVEKVVRCQEEYLRYLEMKDDYLSDCEKDNREFMLGKYKSCQELLETDFSSIKERFTEDEDFLFVRLGIGKIRFQMNVKLKGESRNLFETKEEERAKELVSKYQFIDNCPIGIDFKSVHFIGIDMPKFIESTYEFLLQMVLQIASFTSFNDVKLCVFLNRKNEYQREFANSIKFLPHLFLAGFEKRLLGTDLTGCLNTLFELGEHIKGSDDAYWIVFVLDDCFVSEETSYQSLFQKAHDKTSVILLSDKNNLPGIVKEVIELGKYPNPDFISLENGRRLTENILTRMSENNVTAKGIPAHVDFLDMYQCRNKADFKIEERWNRNFPKERIKVPIGLRDGGRITYLDIHEKYHGPHGIIAGTTGSGKSELIQCYILSLCINYSALFVNFFLIDYKGGGTGNVIDRLPHCAGTISNLSENQIRRAMQALTYEVKRREILLSRLGINHIDAYEKKFTDGLVDVPMPHLVLIIDEFAELKKEEPEFMKEIISLAAVGRSLGIHLVLATQKPAGVVDDKIFSNSNFKLCLRVQDRQDSMDMLKRPEASMLTSPGQCYIEIGNNAYFDRFQTAYCGNEYNPSDKEKPKVSLIDDNAKRTECIRKQHEEGRGKRNSVLTELVNYVNQISETYTFRQFENCRARKLWIDELDDVIELCKLESEYLQRSSDNANADLCKLDLCKPALRKPKAFPLGKYDNPKKQSQGVYLYTPKEDGSVAIIGRSGSGKTSLLNTLISQFDFDEFVLVDINDNSPLRISHRNLLGSVFDESGVDIFLHHLKKEYKRRGQNCSKNQEDGKRLFVLIDNFPKFYFKLKDSDADFIGKLIAEGQGRGVYVIATGNLLSDFPVRVMGKIKTTIAMEMNDCYAYRDILRISNKNIIPKPNTPGRCLIVKNGEVYECQTAIVKSFKEDNQVLGERAFDCKKFPSIPDSLDVRNIINSKMFIECIEKGIIPLGFSMKTGLIRGINLNKGSSFIISDYSQKTIGIIEVIEFILDKFPELRERYKVRCVRSLHEVKTLPDFLIGIYDPSKDQDLMMNPQFGKCLFDGNGLYAGNQPASSRIFNFSDLSFQQLNSPLGKDIGLLRIKESEHTIKLKLLSLLDGEEDEYE